MDLLTAWTAQMREDVLTRRPALRDSSDALSLVAVYQRTGGVTHTMTVEMVLMKLIVNVELTSSNVQPLMEH